MAYIAILHNTVILIPMYIIIYYVPIQLLTILIISKKILFELTFIQGPIPIYLIRIEDL